MRWLQFGVLSRPVSTFIMLLWEKGCTAMQSPREVREFGLKDRITMTGTLSESEVFEKLSEADALLLPSTGLGEAWPVSVMEAMGAGLPVVASVIGATPEMIDSGVDGFLVPQGDQGRLFETIWSLAYDVEQRRRVGRAARKGAAERFDVCKTAGRLLEAIQSGQVYQARKSVNGKSI